MPIQQPKSKPIHLQFINRSVLRLRWTFCNGLGSKIKTTKIKLEKPLNQNYKFAGFRTIFIACSNVTNWIEWIMLLFLKKYANFSSLSCLCLCEKIPWVRDVYFGLGWCIDFFVVFNILPNFLPIRIESLVWWIIIIRTLIRGIRVSWYSESDAKSWLRRWRWCGEAHEAR